MVLVVSPDLFEYVRQLTYQFCETIAFVAFGLALAIAAVRHVIKSIRDDRWNGPKGPPPIF